MIAALAWCVVVLLIGGAQLPKEPDFSGEWVLVKASGGPLADASGRVIGMNTSALSRGFALAISMATLTQVVSQLLREGRVRRGYLGVGLQVVALPESLIGRNPDDQRVLLADGRPGCLQDLARQPHPVLVGAAPRIPARRV